jgi:hypothetical protein
LVNIRGKLFDVLGLFFAIDREGLAKNQPQPIFSSPQPSSLPSSIPSSSK